MEAIGKTPLPSEDKRFTVFLVSPHGMRDLSSPTRDRTHGPALEVQRLNHWTAREVPSLPLLDGS